MINRLRSGLAVLTFTLCLPGLTVAEETGPGPRLEAGDVQRFIDTVPKMMKDLEALGADFGDVKNPTALQGMMAHEKVQEILARYDWHQETYLEKVTAIAGGYAAVRMDEELQALPEEQRAMVKSMMGAQMPKLLMVHPNDVKIVEQHKSALDAFFDSQ